MFNIKNKALVFLAGAALSGALIGCEDAYTVDINDPDWRQSKIDSIAAANATDEDADTVYYVTTKTTVGLTDCSAAWWVYFTDILPIAPGKVGVFEFTNHSSGGGNYMNWNLCVSNSSTGHSTDDDSNYAEYFVIRSDNYGWGGNMANESDDYAYNSANLSINYAEPLGADAMTDDLWATWLSKMDGCYVVLKVDHTTTGKVYVTATMTTTDGYVFVETYNQGVSSADNIYAFLICDHSYFEVDRMYVTASEINITDYDPVSLELANVPSSIPVGSYETVEEAMIAYGVTATVTYEDGSTESLTAAELNFTAIPDFDEVGDQTVIASYSTTSLGNATTTSVVAMATVSIINEPIALTVTSQPTNTTYAYYGTMIPVFDTTGLAVQATYDDGTTSDYDISLLTFGAITAKAGSQNITISRGTVSTYVTIEVIEGIGSVGDVTDFSNGWWSTFTESDTQVTEGNPVTYKMYVYSDNLGNWHSPVTILRQADLSEYAVVRMDNYGWSGTVGGYETATLNSDWDFDTFASNINGSYVEITITATSATTADVYYDVTYANGETHFQSYSGITVDATNLYVGLTTEESYLIFVE